MYKNSCWIDCFVILYILINKKNIVNFINYNNNSDFNMNSKLLNQMTDIIIQRNRNEPIKFMIYITNFQIKLKNFLYLDKSKIGMLNTIDDAYKICNDYLLFCNTSNENHVCNGMCNYSEVI